MLQKIRDRISGWAAGVLFGFLALAFAVWGIQYDFNPGTFAAKVNGEEIPIERAQRAYQNRVNEMQRYFGGDLPQALVAQLRDSVLESEIRETLLRQRADELGYQIADRAVTDAIRRIPQFHIGGEFSEEAYRNYVASQRMTPRLFEENQRLRLRTIQLQNAIAATAFATDFDVETYTALEDEQREVAWLQIPSERYRDPEQIDADSIARYYEENAAEFNTEESADLQYVRLLRADLADEVSVSEEEVREYYDAVAGQRYSVPEERKASHILIAPKDGDEAAAEAQAQSLVARLEAGEDFAALAAEYSADPGSAARGGSLDWATRSTPEQPGTFVPAFEEAVFSMQPGEIRGPVTTRYGAHIIRLDEIRAGSARPYEEVHDELEGELREQAADDVFSERAEELANEAYESSPGLDPVAARFDIELKTLQGFTRNGGGPFGANPEVIETVFSLEVLEDRQNSPLVEIDDGDVAVFRVTDHRLPQQRPLEEVEEEIRATLAQRGAEQAARAAGEAQIERLRGSATLQQVAQDAALEVDGPRRIGRADAELSPTLLSSFFRAPAPTDGSVTATGLALPNGDYVVFVISAVHAGQLDLLDVQQRQQRRQQLAAADGRAEFSAYVEELRRTADVNKPQGVLQDVEY